MTGSNSNYKKCLSFITLLSRESANISLYKPNLLSLKGIHLKSNATPTAAANPEGTPINRLSLSVNKEAVIPIKIIPTPRIWF